MEREREIVRKEDWETEDMPAQNAKFTLRKRFSKEQIRTLKLGHLPREMEDRWFSYFEGNTLYIHRSWTGSCIYAVRFRFRLGLHTVTVNRDPNQYTRTSIQEDKREVAGLLRMLS